MLFLIKSDFLNTLTERIDVIPNGNNENDLGIQFKIPMNDSKISL